MDTFAVRWISIPIRPMRVRPGGVCSRESRGKQHVAASLPMLLSVAMGYIYSPEVKKFQPLCPSLPRQEMEPQYTSSFTALRLHPQLILPLILWGMMYTPTNKILMLLTSRRRPQALISASQLHDHAIATNSLVETSR